MRCSLGAANNHWGVACSRGFYRGSCCPIDDVQHVCALEGWEEAEDEDENFPVPLSPRGIALSDWLAYPFIYPFARFMCRFIHHFV